MEQELIDPSANDPASKAFDRLRREVTTMRLAVEHLADAPGKIEIPDYSETLAEIRGYTQALGTHYRNLRDAPALAVTPDKLAAQINAASAEARRAEQAAFDKATSTFVTLGRELSSLSLTARTAHQQFKEKLWFGSGGIFVGVLLAVTLPTIGAALAPKSWHWPEKMAANRLGLDMGQAGTRLLEVANPDEWRALLTTHQVIKANPQIAGACAKSAKRSGKPVQCSITVAPPAAH